MLNKEVIKSQDGLSDLNEDQLTAIVTLANNTIKSEVATEKGKVFGLEHFGYSAPANVLDDKFGFTGEKVSKEILEYLKTT